MATKTEKKAKKPEKRTDARKPYKRAKTAKQDVPRSRSLAYRKSRRAIRRAKRTTRARQS
jgi:hypothetical protein